MGDWASLQAEGLPRSGARPREERRQGEDTSQPQPRGRTCLTGQSRIPEGQRAGGGATLRHSLGTKVYQGLTGGPHTASACRSPGVTLRQYLHPQIKGCNLSLPPRPWLSTWPFKSFGE